MKKSIFILLVMAFACEPAKKVEKEIVLREDLGGYVFYVSPDGEHGLVAATQDQSTGSNWNDAFGLVNNNANHDVAGANFTDWRLPTKDELNMMYLKKDEIGGFANNNYWSSALFATPIVGERSLLPKTNPLKIHTLIPILPYTVWASDTA